MSAISLALALGVIGTANTGRLVKDLGSPGELARAAALVALAKMGPRAAPALRPICDRASSFCG